uniref:Uncharacterized protein n=1 Tax=Poecilia mexicana TaxID=48701 RepID=A0A3B3X336_9TELE
MTIGRVWLHRGSMQEKLIRSCQAAGKAAHNYQHSPRRAWVICMLLLCGGLVNGPYALITTAVSADLGTHESLRGNSRALSTVTAIIDGTGSIGMHCENHASPHLLIKHTYHTHINTKCNNNHQNKTQDLLRSAKLSWRDVNRTPKNATD